MSFFDPLLTSDGRPYYRVRYEEIVQEQVLLGYLSQGGISYGDTQNMSPHERKIAFKVLKEISDMKKEVFQDQISQKDTKEVIKDPISGLTSR